MVIMLHLLFPSFFLQSFVLLFILNCIYEERAVAPLSLKVFFVGSFFVVVLIILSVASLLKPLRFDEALLFLFPFLWLHPRSVVT